MVTKTTARKTVPKEKKTRDITRRFGIGEWYGKNFAALTSIQRRRFAGSALKSKGKKIAEPCPFRGEDGNVKCSKAGGVCSLRLYGHASEPKTGKSIGVTVVGDIGSYRATCPYRFHEALMVFRWVGETILGDSNPQMVGEVGFLEAAASLDSDAGDDVGRIDMVLVSNRTAPGSPMDWTAVEIQAVYFSGDSMNGEFKANADPSIDWIPFPIGKRRPDYRSSGPKRLMPQLQIKVPTLRRWGKKMAVVVDRAFFDSIGKMDHVKHISNADIAWFIVKFEEVPGTTATRLVKDEVRYTTLERSVEGLTGGTAVEKPIFEGRIAQKLGHLS